MIFKLEKRKEVYIENFSDESMGVIYTSYSFIIG